MPRRANPLDHPVRPAALRILVASSNPGKVAEFRKLAEGRKPSISLNLELLPQFSELPVFDESAPTFAENELAYDDSGVCDHDRLGEGLRRATYNYMHGVGLDVDVRKWFSGAVPRARGV